MRVISQESLNKANLAVHEQFFVELWYSMTHLLSLDSYRVKCMNARTIVRELSEELQIGTIDENDLKTLCTETKEILEQDPIVSKLYRNHMAILTPLLKAPCNLPKPSAKGTVASAEPLKRFRFVVDDLYVAMQDSYFKALCDSLREALKPNNEATIKAALGAFLTDLTDQGWDIGSLYHWHFNFLSKGEVESYSFARNLEFMLRQLQRGPQPFDVVLRLTGSERLQDITTCGEFSIAENATLNIPNDQAKRFSMPHTLVRFARTTVNSVDFLPAAIDAREGFEERLSLLRFDYERRVVKIENVCYVERNGDNRGRVLSVQLALPNPIENIDRDGFDSFVKDVEKVCNKQSIEEASRTQLKAAMRQYLFGRDSANHRDMFLNWWMGMEALAHVGRGKAIGPTVTHNISRIMAITYFFRILRDLQITLKYCEISWPQGLVNHSHCASLNDLSVSQLVSILQSDEHRTLLVEQCNVYPILAYRCKWLGEWMADSKKAAVRFKAHQQNVEWHLQRIYRIRCCIVHGSKIRHRFGLITANLEFYLKQTILLALKAFRNNDHIKNLEELYARASVNCERVVSALETDGAGVDQVRDAVFADVITRGNGGV